MRLTPLLFLCISQTIAFAPRFARVATTQRLFSTSEEKNTNTGHQAPADIAAPAMSAEIEAKIAALRLHQSGAARLSMADEVRTLIEQSIGYGVMSTNSKAFPGYPTGSVVGFALEEDGKPFFVLSTMSAHTGDILKDGKTSLTVMANDFKGASEGRIVLIGDVVKVFDKEVIASLRTKYFARHPGAYWADFG
jgi:Pyridoxamine 5'-phosphate oxidase